MSRPTYDLTITPKVAAVLRVFLEEPDRERYGFELMRLTGQPSGTLYPIMAKLESAGWITGGREQIDPKAEGRPPRRFYRITPVAARLAYDRLISLSDQYRPPPRGDDQSTGQADRLPNGRVDRPPSPEVPGPPAVPRRLDRSAANHPIGKPSRLNRDGDALCPGG